MSETFEIFEAQEPQSYRPPGMSGCAKAAIGCGVIMVIGSIVTGIAVWVVRTPPRNCCTDLPRDCQQIGLAPFRRACKFHRAAWAAC